MLELGDRLPLALQRLHPLSVRLDMVEEQGAILAAGAKRPQRCDREIGLGLRIEREEEIAELPAGESKDPPASPFAGHQRHQPGHPSGGMPNGDQRRRVVPVNAQIGEEPLRGHERR
jgi:hypothetical protein